MLNYVHALVYCAEKDRTLEPIKTQIIETCNDAVTLLVENEDLRKQLELEKTALDVALTSDAFFRKAAADALKRIETLEREREEFRGIARRAANTALAWLDIVESDVEENEETQDARGQAELWLEQTKDDAPEEVSH